MALSVIGAGFGRTGTLSLKFALDQLGFGPCYHMLEVIKNPGFADYWYAAAIGEPVDWDQVFDGYHSTVDWPSTHFYSQLADFYPEAKVILTLRDPERWHQSGENTIFQPLRATMNSEDPEVIARGRMAQKVVLEQAMDGKIDDKEGLIEVFNRHIETVKSTIAPERLLVYEVAEGWGPLCDFLGVPVPDEPFPRVNSSDEFRQIFMSHSADANAPG